MRANQRRHAMFLTVALLVPALCAAVTSAVAAPGAAVSRATHSVTTSDSSAADHREAEDRLRAVSRLAARSARSAAPAACESPLIRAIRAIVDSAAVERQRLEGLVATTTGAERSDWRRQIARLERQVQRRILMVQGAHARRSGQPELARRVELALERLERDDQAHTASSVIPR